MENNFHDAERQTNWNTQNRVKKNLWDKQENDKS